MCAFSPLQVNLPIHVVTEVGVQLGVCEKDSTEIHQLTRDYFRIIQTVKKQQMRVKGECRCWAEVNFFLSL